jgi:hypothetical protein
MSRLLACRIVVAKTPHVQILSASSDSIDFGAAARAASAIIHAKKPANALAGPRDGCFSALSILARQQETGEPQRRRAQKP